MREDDAARGRPSTVWRFGQERRLQLIRHHGHPSGAVALDVGCGIGLYADRLAQAGATALGVEVEWARAREARAGGIAVAAAVAEALPFADGSVDLVLLHEVLEHVADDRAGLREAARILVPGGRAVVFAPNRLWPFETHGVVWRGRYRFGNFPLVGYLPDGLRNRLAPHVRTYTAGGLRSLVEGLPVRVIVHTQVYPGYDRLVERHPRWGRLLRQLTYALEGTALGSFGLSHLLVIERL